MSLFALSLSSTRNGASPVFSMGIRMVVLRPVNVNAYAGRGMTAPVIVWNSAVSSAAVVSTSEDVSEEDDSTSMVVDHRAARPSSSTSIEVRLEACVASRSSVLSRVDMSRGDVSGNTISTGSPPTIIVLVERSTRSSPTKRTAAVGAISSCTRASSVGLGTPPVSSPMIIVWPSTGDSILAI